MAKKKAPRSPRRPQQSLRDRAETLARPIPPDVSAQSSHDLHRLVHDLQVHQIELELQNEELRQSQLELTIARERYADLYEFAPVSYLSLNADGLVLDANLSAAQLLGIERSVLLHRPFHRWVHPDAQGDLHSALRNAIPSPLRSTSELRLLPADGRLLHVRADLIAVPHRSPHGIPSSPTPAVRATLIDITEQKTAQEALQKLNIDLKFSLTESAGKLDVSLHRLKLLSEAIAHLGEGVLITRDHLDWPGPEIVFVNEALCRITGYRAEELIGQNPRILHGLDMDPNMLRQIREDLAAAQGSLVTLVNHRKNGDPYHAELFISPLFDEHQRRTNFVSIYRDITKRHEAEITLRSSEARTRAILASLPAHIAVIDRQGTITAVNPAWEQFAALNGADQARCGPGANYLEACRSSGQEGDEATDVAAALKSVLNGTSAFYSHQYPCHLATEDRWFLMQAAPLHKPGGGAVISHLDITGRVRSEQRLRESEQRLRATLRTASDAIITLDPEGLILEVNPATEPLFGYREDELTGRNISILSARLHGSSEPVNPSSWLVPDERGLLTLSGETMGRRKDGSTFPIDFSVSKVGDLDLFTGILRDATERKLLEERLGELVEARTRELSDAQAELIRKERLATLGRLAGSMAHELRNPLGVIRNAAYYLNTTLDQRGSEIPQVLREVERSIVSADSIIRELLDYAREPPLESIPTSLHEALSRALELVPIPPEINLIQTGPDTPATASASPDQVTRILVNLIQNAVQAMPDGGLLAIEVSGGEDEVSVAVRDSGAGIEPERLARIFEPLYTTKTRGIGLGLTISQRYAELHGGRIEVESMPDQGAAFRLFLPTGDLPPP